MNNLDRAKLIAETAHGATGQKRKYTGKPYIVHPAEVFLILINAGIKDENILSAAWLHDVVEDTEITLEFVFKNVGFEVSKIVEMVTDISKPEDGNRKVRKQIDREHYLIADYRGKTVKLADCLSNGRDIEKNDRNFSVVYFKEIKLLLPYLKGGEESLYNDVENMISEYENRTEYERLQTALKTNDENK